MRAAIILPWVGGEMPLHLSFTCYTMLGGSKTATLLLFHESAQRSSVPEACRMSRNVEVNEVGDGGIAALHARRIYEAMGYQDQGQAGELQQKLARLFDIAPACLPEFKPSWGWVFGEYLNCLLYTSPSPRDQRGSRMPSSA